MKQGRRAVGTTSSSDPIGKIAASNQTPSHIETPPNQSESSNKRLLDGKTTLNRVMLHLRFP